MKLILIVPIVLSLVGCHTMRGGGEYSTLRLDPRVLEPCKQLVSPSEPLTFESILENTKDNVLVYNECKTKHDTAIVLLKELTNQKD